MKFLKSMAVVSTVLFFAACSATLPSSAGEIEKHSGKKVFATVSTMNFLGFSPITIEKSSEAIDELAQQCDSGEVTGVSSLVKQTWLVVIMKEEFSVAGYCK